MCAVGSADSVFFGEDWNDIGRRERGLLGIGGRRGEGEREKEKEDEERRRGCRGWR